MRLRPYSRGPTAIFWSSAMLLALGVVAAWYVHKVHRDLSEVLTLNVASVRAAEELEIGMREIRTRLSETMTGSAVDPRPDIDSLQRTTDRWLVEATRLATTPTEQEIIGRVRAGYDHFFEELSGILALPPEARTVPIRTLIERVLTQEIIAPAHEYLDYNEQTMIAVTKQNEIVTDRMIAGLLTLGVCGSVAGFLAGIQASRRQRRTLVELHLPLKLTAGRLNEVVGPIRLTTGADLHELKEVLQTISVEVDRVVDRLHASQQEVMRSEKLAALGQLAAGMAHEIRNPLTAMKALVQAAREGSEPRLEGEDLAIVDAEIDRLERTTQGLLDFAKPPALDKGHFPLARLIRHAVSLIGSTAAIHGVTVRCGDLDPAVEIEADYQQLFQVVLNLLLNALDATQRGGAVEVCMEHVEGRVKVTVADDGEGLPAQLGAKIFEPFVSTKATGTGLGLSTCRRIVQAHAGEIDAASRAEGGALFWFSLPLSPRRSS